MADLDLNEKYEKYSPKNGEDKEIYEIYDAIKSKKEKACLKVLNLKNKEFEEEDLNIYITIYILNKPRFFSESIIMNFIRKQNILRFCFSISSN